MKRDLSEFKVKNSRSFKLQHVCWWLVQNLIFKTFWFPSKARVATLRLFGAKIGQQVLIRRGVRVHFPEKLTIGDNSWIGEDVWFINHEGIDIGSNVCVSQSVVICSSSHDFRTSSLDYKHSDIQICDGAWICLRATILAGGKIGVNSVVSAGEVFAGDLKDEHIFVNGIEKPIGYLD
jgi:putative colanic acid biosynthesis acetyltransferase WcaF